MAKQVVSDMTDTALPGKGAAATLTDGLGRTRYSSQNRRNRGSMARKNRKVIVYSAIAAIVLISALAGYLFIWSSPHPPPYATYFTYTSDELDSLRELSSDKRVSIDDLFEWEDMLFDLVSEEKIETKKVKKLLPYLVVAQRDAAFLSSKVHREFRGSIDPVSRKVACIFAPDSCLEMPVETDAYSELLAEIALRKVEARISEAESETKSYVMRPGDRYWDNGGPKVLSQKTWLIDSPGRYRVPEPPEYGSDADKNQVKMVRDALTNITDDQILAVLGWSGGRYTIGTNALWLELATKYMRRTGFSDLARALTICSVLMMTVLDTRSAVDDSKLTHLVKRPSKRLDPNDPIYTIMPTSLTSSAYPSTSAAVASASTIIMTHYFPENTDEWTAIAKEIGESRVWSGIHDPMDVEQGTILGRRVALEILTSAEITRPGPG